MILMIWQWLYNYFLDTLIVELTKSGLECNVGPVVRSVGDKFLEKINLFDFCDITG